MVRCARCRVPMGSDEPAGAALCRQCLRHWQEDETGGWLLAVAVFGVVAMALAFAWETA